MLLAHVDRCSLCDSNVFSQHVIQSETLKTAHPNYTPFAVVVTTYSAVRFLSLTLGGLRDMHHPKVSLSWDSFEDICRLFDC